MNNVNCFGYETSLTQCRQVGWGRGNCDPYHSEDAGVVCGNTTIEELSNNYCRKINQGLCSESTVRSLSRKLITLYYYLRLIQSLKLLFSRGWRQKTEHSAPKVSGRKLAYW